MHVLLTGAAGFIGRHTLRTLLEDGHRVTPLDRESPRPVADETWITTDLARPSDVLRGLIEEVDAVVHLAGCPGVRDRSPGVARQRWRDNVLAGAAVLENVPLDRQVVVVSSSSVYGGSGSLSATRPSVETDERRPLGGYARSKVALEDLAAHRAASGGRVVVVRPFTVAGPGQRPDMAISRWIEAVRSGQPAVLLGDPARSRDITDVRMVAKGLARLVVSDAEGTVNFGSGRAHRLDEMITAVGRALGVTPDVEILPAHPDEVEVTLADTTRCRELTGLALGTDLDELVAAQVEHAMHAANIAV